MTAGQQTQVANRQLVQLLSAWFQSRREASFAWSRAASEYLALPGLRGFWPMSSVDYTAASRARDLSGQGYHLTDNNTPTFNFDGLAPYVEFNGTTQYLSRADGGVGNWADILGTETYIDAAIRGLTLGGWFYFDDATPATTEDCIDKRVAAAANSSYSLGRLATAQIFFNVSTGAGFVTAPGANVGADRWVFLVGRYIPSTSVDVFVDDDEVNTVIGVPASLVDSTAPFTIGARGVPSQYLDGRASMCFLCAAALSDAIILSLFEQTKAMFGVD